MKSVQDLKIFGKNINSACNVVNLQSESPGTVHEPVRDSDLIIDINSDAQSYVDDQKSFLSNEYNFEQDVEKLIEVSKQFQRDYENEKNVCSVVVDDPNQQLNIQDLSSRTSSLISRPKSALDAYEQLNDVDNYYFSSCSTRSKKENIYNLGSRQHSKKFTPKIPNAGPFGTGIIRPSPKKHSCIEKTELTKRSCHVACKSARYYNFDRTHPNFQLIENGDTIIPKRILKETTQMTEKFKSTAIKKPLLNKGLTWHEFFERSNVYSAKSLQSSYGYCHTQTDVESPTKKSDENSKIQKHVAMESSSFNQCDRDGIIIQPKCSLWNLPHLNIRAECSVQRIPDISIAPNALQHTVKSNIKLVEIIYGESDDSREKIIEPLKECVDSMSGDKRNIAELQPYRSESENTPPIEFEMNESYQINESKISSITPSNTSMSNNGYDSSLEDSVSLNVSRVSAQTDVETGRRLLNNGSIENHKIKRFAKHRKGTSIERASKSSTSHCCDFELDSQHLIEPQRITTHGDSTYTNLPTFPTNELIKMVDEIFDTSSDGWTEKNTVNMSYKHVVKETSVQTDIVWENISQFFRQHGTIQSPTSGAIEKKSTDNSAKPNEVFQTNVPNTKEVEDHRFVNTRPVETNQLDANILQNRDMIATENCQHNRMKKFKICSCLHCKNNIRFSVMNINQSSQSPDVTSSSSSSFAVAKIVKSKSTVKTNLLPSERYKKMKQAQREHFENDPRISKTLKKIYATASAVKATQNDTTTSSSSNQFRIRGVERSNNVFVEDESLQPDLYTYSDEVLLFGYSTDEIHYSSYLLKTESSQDTSMSNDRFCGIETSKDVLLRNKLMCTNSEDSSLQRGSDMERDLLKDIENSGSDPAVLSSVFSSSSLDRKVNEIQLNDRKCK